MDKKIIIQHGCYSATIQLYDEPITDKMVGMMSVKNPVDGEHFIKLTREDLENIQENISEYLLEQFSN